MSLKDNDWDDLLESIKEKKCTPFIGERACAPWLPFGRDLASKWADEHGYPLEDSYQLSRVAQFLAIEEGDNNHPKHILRKHLEKVEPPNFSLEEHRKTPYSVLADLNLPVYITTNHDLFMEAALKSKGKAPVSDFCLWNKDLRSLAKTAEIFSVFERGSKYRPTPSSPLVYHLYGLYCLSVQYRPNDRDIQDDKDIPQSMVLTEKDYIDFVINLNKEDEKIIFPPVIRQALAMTSLLFIGYSLDDISFRVIFQGVVSLQASMRKTSIAVQFPPRIAYNKPDQARKYLDQYTKDMFKVHVYWGDASEFSKELRQRWDNFKK